MKNKIVLLLTISIQLLCNFQINAQHKKDTLKVFGLDLRDNKDYGNNFIEFKRFCLDSNHLKNGKSFFINKDISEKDLKLINQLCNSLKTDTNCLLTNRSVGFKYRANFIFTTKNETFELAISAEDSQFILLNEKKYNRCKPLYKLLANQIPRKYRRGMKFIEFYSNCCVK